MVFTVSNLLNIFITFFLTCKCTSIPPVILISFDGFRYDYLEKAPTKNFKRLTDNGVRAKWMNNVFATKTFPNHFSIVTGLYEETHGIVGNEMYDPVFNEVFHMNNTDPKWWDNGFSIPIWVANQIAGHHSASVMWPGTNVEIHNQTIDYLQPYNPNITWTSRVDIGLKWLTEEPNPPNLLMLYIEEPDGTGHKYGPDSKEIVEKIMEIDNLVGYLLDNLEKKSLLSKVNLIILSDHGMTTVTKKHLINLDDILNSTHYKHYGVSPVWNILPVPGEENYVYEKLLEGSDTYHYHLSKKNNIPDDYHYKHNRRVLTYLIEAEAGYDFVLTNQDWHNNDEWGNHGYNPAVKEMRPIFIATGPSFKKKYTAEPFMNLDVFPLLCHLLQIPESPNNGSLTSIDHILKPHGMLETAFSSPWIIGCVSIMCIFLAIGLTGAAMSMAFGKRPPTVAFVVLRNQHIVADKELNVSQEEKTQLLDDTD